MDKIRVGIDIGSDGAFAIFQNNVLALMGKIPKISEEQDMSKLSTLLSAFGFDDMHVVIEDLHSVFGSSASSNFAFGQNNGLIKGMLQTLQIPHTLIGPKKWQKELWQGIRPVEILVKGKTNKDGSPKYKVDTKATSLIAAKRLFPKESFLATERSKVPHDGIVDSVLIAEFCRRNF